MSAIRWKRRFQSFPQLSVALLGIRYATDDWCDDMPILDSELSILQGHFLEFLPESNETEL